MMMNGRYTLNYSEICIDLTEATPLSIIYILIPMYEKWTENSSTDVDIDYKQNSYSPKTWGT